MRRVSAIVTTYNRSGHLRNCIASIERQSRLPDEVVIADDGSGPEHVAAIERIMGASPLSVVYARQEHAGFRAAANRNNGVRHSSGDHLFFVDGDAVLFPDVLERHLSVSGRGAWATGSAVWLTEEEAARLSVELICEGRLGEFWPDDGDERLRLMRKAHRRFRRKRLWARIVPLEFCFRKIRLLTIQCSVSREDFEKVNGLDENFVGWGREDDDLALRLSIAGVRGRSVMLVARALHQFHPMEPRTGIRKGRATSANNDYHNRPRRGQYRCEDGLQPPG